MAGCSQGLTIITMDKNDSMHVMHYKENNLKKKDNYASIENVIYPFDFFIAIQPCDREQYIEIKEGLL